MSTRKPYLVTTAHRGVFFCWLDANADLFAPSLTAYDVQLVVYWSAGVRGFLGLAATGPISDCRITAPVKGAVILHAVTSVAECTPTAIEAFQKAPWAS